MESDLMPAELKISIRDLTSANEEKDFLAQPVLIRSA